MEFAERCLRNWMSASKKKFLTVVKLVVIGVIICLFGAIAVPKFIEIRNADMANRCVSNLRDIDSVKYQWALENHAVEVHRHHFINNICVGKGCFGSKYKNLSSAHKKPDSSSY